MMRKVGLALLMCAGCAVAQTNKTAERNVVVRMGDAAEFGPLGITTMLAGPIGTVSGAPYSAQVVTERIQVLTDGNRIDQTSTGSVARDSQGRIRRDEALPSLEGDRGESAHVVMIDDPVAQVHWTLDTLSKTAMKMSPPPGNTFFASVPPPPAGPNRTVFYSAIGGGASGLTMNKQIIMKNAPGTPDPNVTKTDLGTQMVEGVSAQGTKYTRTIPARQIGNEQPITITTETWYSPELKVLVTSKSVDPRLGETIYKLTEIQRVEPAANLFQPPDDYTVKEGPQDHLVVRENKK
ncbi:MAG: hypothetical protein ACJ746_03885 [Bryobacteraceae bacterium]